MNLLVNRVSAVALAAMLSAGCEKPAASPALPDAFVSSLANSRGSLQRLEDTLQEQEKRVRAIAEPSLTARVRDGLAVERTLLLQAQKSIVTARELVRVGSDPVADRLDAEARVSVALKAATAARAENEALWVNLQSEMAKRGAAQDLKAEHESKKDE